MRFLPKSDSVKSLGPPSPTGNPESAPDNSIADIKWEVSCIVFLKEYVQKEEMKEFEEADKELRLLPPADSEICLYDITAVPSNQNQNNILFNIDTYQENIKSKFQKTGQDM